MCPSISIRFSVNVSGHLVNLTMMAIVDYVFSSTDLDLLLYLMILDNSHDDYNYYSSQVIPKAPYFSALPISTP